MEPQENLTQLFEKFLDSGQAQDAAGDIEQGLQMVAQYPAPQPDKRLIDSIKTKTANALREKKAKAHSRRIYRAAAVAAAVLIAGALSVRLYRPDWFHTSQRQLTMDAAVWESDDIADADLELAELGDEIDQLASEILTLRFGDMDGIEYEVGSDLEMELIEIDSDFWKG
ncbi:MAG TPA: hypothetical protein VMW23_07410 [Sedimentisphaerales bacterium]|nr:hypothetical protein [Sedimentisphaerales bacterium]